MKRLFRTSIFASKQDEQNLIDFAGEDLAKRFFDVRNRLESPENDLYYWIKNATPEELEDRLDEVNSKSTRSKRDREASEGADIIYSNDGWRVYHITTYAASAKYGKNTQWCITGSKRWANGENGENYFNDYTKKGVEFYFYIKSDDKKYALALTPRNGRYQVFNQLDKDITSRLAEHKLPNVPGLPKLDYSDMLPKDNTYVYNGNKILKPLKDLIKKVIVLDSVTSISNSAFSGCKKLTSITISDSVTSIGEYAFNNCTNLTSINIPNSVTSMGDSAFQNCKSLASVTISDSVTEIGRSAFYGCKSLASINIPDSVTSIGKFAFAGCTSLTDVTISNSVTSIGFRAFADCPALMSINIPNSVTSIGNDAFDESENLVVYTNNRYVQDYCDIHEVVWRLL